MVVFFLTAQPTMCLKSESDGAFKGRIESYVRYVTAKRTPARKISKYLGYELYCGKHVDIEYEAVV